MQSFSTTRFVEANKNTMQYKRYIGQYSSFNTNTMDFFDALN